MTRFVESAPNNYEPSRASTSCRNQNAESDAPGRPGVPLLHGLEIPNSPSENFNAAIGIRFLVPNLMILGQKLIQSFCGSNAQSYAEQFFLPKMHPSRPFPIFPYFLEWEQWRFTELTIDCLQIVSVTLSLLQGLPWSGAWCLIPGPMANPARHVQSLSLARPRPDPARTAPACCHHQPPRRYSVPTHWH
jgi:hypothetical protein